MAEARKYISLSEAAIYSGCYSQEYLSLRARHGKLKAVKFGRNWVTTKEWLNEYLEGVNNYKNNQKKHEKGRLPDKHLVPSYSSPSLNNYFQPARKVRFVLAYVLVFLLLSTGIVLAYPYLDPVFKSANTFIRDNSNQLAVNILSFSNDVSEDINDISEDIGEFSQNIL